MKYRQTMWAILACMACAVQAQADDIGTMIVTDDKAPSKAETSAHSVTVIDREMIERSHASSVAELLRGVANIVVRDVTGVGAKSQVDLGGYGESAAANSVVLIDGRRVNAPDLSGVDWSQVPVDQIERVEIVHGGGSVLYGQGAVGGVINIITRVPESGGQAMIEAGSFGHYNAAVRAGVDSDTSRMEINVSGQSTDGYRKNSSFERFDGGARAEVDLSSSLMASLKGNFHHDRVGLPGSLTATQVAADPRQTNNPNDFARTDDGFIDGGLLWDITSGLELNVEGGVRRRNVHSEWISFTANSDYLLLDKSVRPYLRYTFGDAVRTSVTAGADIHAGDGSFAFGGAFPLPTTTFSRSHQGYYAYTDVRDDGGRWHLNGGVRSERLSDTFVQATRQQVSQNRTVWEIGASVAPVRQLHVRASASTSVRFPLLDERFSFFTGTVNTALVAQTGQHWGVGMRFGDERTSLDVGFNRADLKHEIFYNPLLFANANYTDPTRHDVLMLQGHWRITALADVSASYTYTKATFRGGAFDGKDVPAVPQHAFGGRVNSDWGNGFTTVLDGSYVGASYLISDQGNVRPKLAAYFLLNAAVNYQWHDIEFFVRGENLTNTKYSSYGVKGFAGDAFYPSPTISVRGGIRYSF